MKVFKTDPDTWGEKINFVDENNVLVGFDFGQDCCESFGWFLSTGVPSQIDYKADGEGADRLEGFVFDTDFFEETTAQDSWNEDHIATFRAVKGDEVIYLNLFNSHNGYYSHGFTMEVGGEKIQNSSL